MRSVQVGSTGQDRVAVVELRRPPENYLTHEMLSGLVEALVELAEDPATRAVVVASEGRHFCAGRNFGAQRAAGDTSENVYRTAARLVEVDIPWVAALTGGSIGAGLGLAVLADQRVAAETAYLSGNFVKLGLHHGFGLSATLPALLGVHQAGRLLTTGSRVGAQEAYRIGLVDEVAAESEVLEAARRRAADLAALPPLAVSSVRRTLRAGLAESFREAVAHELGEQTRLAGTADAREAAAAARERRPGVYQGA